MRPPAESAPDVCVIGRADFRSGIALVGFAAAEMFARSFATCYLPLEPHLRDQEFITLPNGRRLQVAHDSSNCKVCFFTGVVWNGVEDFNYQLVPEHGLRLAHVNFDSNRLPSQWVRILNDRFDIVAVPSRHLVEVLRTSGVEPPISILPIALDLDGWLAAPPTSIRVGPTVRFVSVGSFHPRKGADILVEAFAKAFGDSPKVSLRLHSNLAFGNSLDRVRDRVAKLCLRNVEVTFGQLTTSEVDQLIQASDVFVSCSGGEGYSIPPRVALAAGKALVISAEGGHADLLGPRGIFPIFPSLRIPARYPEIDDGLFGERGLLQVDDVAERLRDALAYARTSAYGTDAPQRRERASAFTFSRLALPYCEQIDPCIRAFRRDEPPHSLVEHPAPAREVVLMALGPYSARLRMPRKRVVLAHDGGFFSVFNTFLSHLVWDLRDPECRMVLPDWDIDRMMRIRGLAKFTSFCYGQPGDGNIWSRLFFPPYELPEHLLDDESFLWDRSTRPTATFNESREPDLTYIQAHKLYRDPDFLAIRRQYNRAYQQHVRIRSHLLAEVDDLTSAFGGKFMIGAHVRHPSHGVEQPGGVIPSVGRYIAEIRELVNFRGIGIESEDWGVFLATDQNRVVARFHEEFGDHLYAFPEVRRTTEVEDRQFEMLPVAEQLQDGNQLQHLVAADPTSWSVGMAEQVLRDAVALSRCELLLHVVSNVATAVAFMNPALEMRLMLPESEV